MSILPFKEDCLGLFGLAIPVCHSLTHLPYCRCVSDYACFRMCVNNTRPTLPLIGLPRHVTLPQPIFIINAIVSCPLTKKEQ